MKSCNCVVSKSASASLAALALLSFAAGPVLARGPVGGPGLNALSTTPYGTQITPTNQGPVGGRPSGFYGSLLSQPVPRGSTNTNAVMNSVNGMNIRNVPYTGPSAGALTSPNFTAPQFNGSGMAAGMRVTSFSMTTPGPIMLPQSLGNPQQPGGAKQPYGANVLAPWAPFNYRSLSAYGSAQRGQQNSTEGNSRSENAPAPENSNRIDPATTNIGIPGAGNPGAPFDYHALSAYGYTERGQSPNAAPAIPPAAKAQGTPANSPRGGNQPANSNGAQTPATPAQ
jgi:hypothetical protein